MSDKEMEECYIKAKIAEVAERYDDMRLNMKMLVEKKLSKAKGMSDEDLKTVDILEVEQRNLLSVAYKNVVGAKRTAWRTLKHTLGDGEENKEIEEKYKLALEKELQDVCEEAIKLLKELCAKTQVKADETTVFYLKMKGDYHRYLAEFSDGEQCRKDCEEAYKGAMEVAEKSLNETHPTRLGLALNFSVCYYEILKKPTKACELAKKAFDAAIEKLDSLNDTSYKDSTLIMQLLRDNLTLWTSENAENDKNGAS